MKYYLISDSKCIAEDIEHFKKYSTQFLKENGIIFIDVKVRLVIEEGMDSIYCEIT